MIHIAIKFIEIAVLSLVGLYIQSRPNSIFSRLALMRIPFIPSPESNESEFDYLKRYSLWAFMWFIRVLLIDAAAWYLLDSVMDGYMLIGFVVNFAMPVLAGVCLMRSGILFIKAVLCKARNIRKIFQSSEGRFVIDETRDTYDAVTNHVI